MIIYFIHALIKPFIYCITVLAFLSFVISCDSSKPPTKSTSNYSSDHASLKSDTLLVLNVDGVSLGYDDMHFVGKLKSRFESDEEINCNNWLIEERDMEELLSSLKKVDGTEWGGRCYTYPCSFFGQVTNGQSSFDISINAASYVTLTNEKEVLYFIEESASQEFLQPCNCCE